MEKREEILLESQEEEMISFLRTLIEINNTTCREKEMAEKVREKMEELEYDRVETDDMGNVIGVMGSGKPSLLFDCHMDTVSVIDAHRWKHNPFGGEIEDGKIYGRGSSDMKAGIVSAVYAVNAAKKSGLIRDGESVWVTCTVAEEDYEGVALKYVLDSHNIRPESVIICEPTEGLRVANGHKGRALIEIRASGRASHACYPEKGINPIYLLYPVIERIKKKNEEYFKSPGDHPTLAVTTFSVVSAGENAVPEEALITIDRRSLPGETEEDISAEFDKIVKGEERITWRFKDYVFSSWTGMEFTYHNCVPAWEIPEDSTLIRRTLDAVEKVKGQKSGVFKFSGSTNGVTSCGLYSIPSVIIGPGNLSCAHARDEYCPVSDLLKAALVYADLIKA